MRFVRSDTCLSCGVSFGVERPRVNLERRLCSSSLSQSLRKRQTRKSHSRTVKRVQCLKDISGSNFKEEVLESDVPVLIDFWATWCGPCKLLEPTMKWLEEAYEGRLRVFKIETDKNPEIIEKYKVYGLPTIVLFRDGDVIKESKREGAITQDEIVAYLDKYGIVPNAATSP